MTRRTPTIAAFDPGKSGAFAIAKPTHIVHGAARAIYSVDDLPLMGAGKQIILNGAAIARTLAAAHVRHVIIERVHSMPGQGVAGVFKFGTVFGQILGVVQALEIPYELIEPSKWKRALGLPGGPGKGEASRGRALELFPHLSAELARKMDHNRAEALLLARWWLVKSGG